MIATTITNRRRDTSKYLHAQCTNQAPIRLHIVHGTHPNRKTGSDFAGSESRPTIRDKFTIPPGTAPYIDDFGRFGSTPFLVHCAYSVSGSGGVGA